MSTVGTWGWSPPLPLPGAGEFGGAALLLPDEFEVPVGGRVEEEVVDVGAGAVAVDLVDQLDERAALHHEPLELVVELPSFLEVHLGLGLAKDRVDLGVLPAGVAGVGAAVG